MTAKESSDLVSGEALATPRAKAEQRVLELLSPAADALKRILTTELGAIDNVAQSNAMKVQLTAAMHVIDGCMGMAEQGGKATKSAARILAAVGGNAVTAELAKRYALKQRDSERARFVDAVPAQVDTTKESSPAITNDSQPTQASDVGDTGEG